MVSLRNYLLTALISFSLLVSFASAESRIVSVTIDNPDGPLTEARVTFYIPFGVAPINLASNMSWNEPARELVIDLGGFADRESKIINFTLEGSEGKYLLSGKAIGRWPAGNGQPEETFELSIDNFAVTLGLAVAPTIGDFLRNLKSIPELVDFAESVAKPLSIALGAGGVAAVVNSAFSASASFAASISKFASYLGLGFLRIRRRKPWGRVYNHLTGKPIDGVVVRVLDTQFKKVKETQITDAEGRFGFLVSPGEYYLKISKRGFAEKETQIMKIISPAQALNLEIALEPLQSELPAGVFKALKILHALGHVLDKLSYWFLVIGIILAIISALLSPSLLSYIILGAYVVLIVLKIVLRGVFFKSFGWVLDKSTEKPVGLAVVRIFDTNKNWLLSTKVTDHDGRFNFLIGPGDYYVTAAKDGYKPFQSASTHFTKHGLISYDIKLEKS